MKSETKRFKLPFHVVKRLDMPKQQYWTIKVCGFFTAFYIQNSCVAWVVQTEVVEPAALLTPFVAVVFILGRSLYVAKEEQQAFLAGSFHFLNKCLAAIDISIFAEHGYVI